MKNLKRSNPRVNQQQTLYGNPVWRALSANPLREAEQVDISLLTHSAFDELVRGEAKKEHFMALMTACSLAAALVSRGYGKEYCEVIHQAQSALVRCGLAQAQGAGYLLDGVAADAIRDLLQLQAEQNRLASRSEVVTAIARVNAEIRSNACRNAVVRVNK
jgi:hypothetical protein